MNRITLNLLLMAPPDAPHYGRTLCRLLPYHIFFCHAVEFYIGTENGHSSEAFAYFRADSADH